MRENLLPPRFSDGEVEISFRKAQLSIDMTYEGLLRLIELLTKLKEQVDRTKQNEHIHLEDYEVLTSNSPPCVIGVFTELHRGDEDESSSRRVSVTQRLWAVVKQRLLKGRL
ncbi:hypothetical protein JCM19992_00760 [Thermostilla marina]